jgi:hypothetical protein
MNLYLVSATDANGENKDLFVTAPDAAVAETVMLEYYDETMKNMMAFRVIKVPRTQILHPVVGAIEWDEIEQIIVKK